MNELVEAAAAAARKAGALIRRYVARTLRHETKAHPNDLVSEVDRRAEAIIKAEVLGRFPGHGFLGEESFSAARTARLDAPVVWVVDPLDGTNNFLGNLPYYCVSIAAVAPPEALKPAARAAMAHRLLAAAIYDPVRREMFTAAAGQGAYLNGRPIRVHPAATLQEGIVSTRTPFNWKTERPENVEALLRVIPRSRSTRNLGAAALEMAWVAAGRLTAYWEMRLSPWDFAAGVLLVKEAGGAVTRHDANLVRPLERGSIVASNGKVHAELLALIGARE